MTRDEIIALTNKRFGAGSVFVLNNDDNSASVPVRSSGAFSLDYALGGGYPKGRFVIIYGEHNVGKTTLLGLAIAEAQRAEPDKLAGIVDVEQCLNVQWFETLGVDLSRLLIAQPSKGAEEVYDIANMWVETNSMSIVGIDSIAAMGSFEELGEDDWEKESRMGGISRIHAKAMRKIVWSGKLSKSGTTLIAINQVRDKMGGFVRGTTTDQGGGHAIKFAASIILEVRISDVSAISGNEHVARTGHEMGIKTVKNKVFPPYRKANLQIVYGQGIDIIYDLVTTAKVLGVFTGTSWLTLCDATTGEVQMNGDVPIKFHGLSKTMDAVRDSAVGDGVLYNQVVALTNGAVGKHG